jgi:hypothetical protein
VKFGQRDGDHLYAQARHRPLLHRCCHPGAASPVIANIGGDFSNPATHHGLFYAWFYLFPTMVDQWLWPDGDALMVTLAMFVFTVQYLTLFGVGAALFRLATIKKGFHQPAPASRRVDAAGLRRATPARQLDGDREPSSIACLRGLGDSATRPEIAALSWVTSESGRMQRRWASHRSLVAGGGDRGDEGPQPRNAHAGCPASVSGREPTSGGNQIERYRTLDSSSTARIEAT